MLLKNLFSTDAFRLLKRRYPIVPHYHNTEDFVYTISSYEDNFIVNNLSIHDNCILKKLTTTKIRKLYKKEKLTVHKTLINFKIKIPYVSYKTKLEDSKCYVSLIKCPPYLSLYHYYTEEEYEAHEFSIDKVFNLNELKHLKDLLNCSSNLRYLYKLL